MLSQVRPTISKTSNLKLGRTRENLIISHLKMLILIMPMKMLRAVPLRNKKVLMMTMKPLKKLKRERRKKAPKHV